MDIIEQVAEIREKKALEKGIQEGRQEVQETSVKAFLANTEFSADKIAEFVGVSVAFVEEVKKKLNKK